jgi:hypothetical protein
MLQAEIVVLAAFCLVAIQTNTTQTPGPAQSFHPWREASLRQNSLGGEIDITAMHSITVNQLPQSGISRNTQCCSKQIQSTLVGTIVLTDWY